MHGPASRDQFQPRSTAFEREMLHTARPPFPSSHSIIHRATAIHEDGGDDGSEEHKVAVKQARASVNRVEPRSVETPMFRYISVLVLHRFVLNLLRNQLIRTFVS